MSWLDAEVGGQVAAFQTSGGYAEWKARLDSEYESILEKVKEAGNQYHEYQWLIGRLSGIEHAVAEMNGLAIDGMEAGKDLVG